MRFQFAYIYITNFSLKFGLTGSHEFEPPIFYLNICFLFMYLIINNSKLCLICLTPPHVRMWPNIKDDMKHDIHI